MGEVIHGDIFCKDKIGNFIDDGYNGSAYRYDDDKVIKIQECPGSAYQYDVVCSIKNLNLANFYRLYDVLYIEKCGLRTFKGTISQYYSDVDINLWTERVDYVIDGFNGILNSASRLGENRILINDISLNNVILTSNGPVVIDVDDYIKDLSSSSSLEITLENFRILKENVFSGLLLSHYMRYLIDGRNNGQIIADERSKVLGFIDQLVNSDNANDKDAFFRSLSKYKYPIDYLKHR